MNQYTVVNMTACSEERKNRSRSHSAGNSDKQSQWQTDQKYQAIIEHGHGQEQIEDHHASNCATTLSQTLLQNQRKRHHFLKRFLFTLLLLNLLPNSAVNALALNVNNHESPESNSSPLHQFYFRNSSKNSAAAAAEASNTHSSQPVVIISSSDNNDSQTDAEPKSNLGLSNVSAFSNVNSAENSIQHEHDEHEHGKDVKTGQQQQLNSSSSGAPTAHKNETRINSKPVCEKNGTAGYQHSVEDILRQIFGDGLDEDETDEDEDDEEFINEHYRDRDDRYEFERSTFTGPTTVHHARQIRDIDSRRGPLQIDDDESAQSTEEEEDEVQPQPPPKVPKKTPATAQNNKNRMNPPKQQVQQQQNRKKQQGNRKQPQKKAPVNPAEKKAEMLAKYNAYVDAVFSRMNVLIKKKRMDPLRMNLYAGPSKPAGGNGGGNNGSGSSGGNGGGVAKNGKRKGSLVKNNKKKNSRMEMDDDSTSAGHDDVGPSEERDDDEEQESSGASSADEERAFRGDVGGGDSSAAHDVHLNSNMFGRNIRSLLANISQYSHAVLSNPSPSSERDDIEDDSHGELETDTMEEGRGNVNSKAPKKNIKNRNGGLQNKNKNGTRSEAKNNKNKFNNKNKNKNKNKNAPRPTRGILHGLSSLRRDGNVQVVKDGPKARIVRAKFLLGPVALEILPKKGKQNRGQSRENHENNVDASTSRQGSSPAGSSPAETASGTNAGDEASSNGSSTAGADGTSSTGTAPAATATAPQLRGILEIRLAPNRPTRIRKLRVFPPGNVQVEGDKATTNSGGGSTSKGSGYRKVTPQATARLRQTALQVVRQVDKRLRPDSGSGNGKPKKPVHRDEIQE